MTELEQYFVLATITLTAVVTLLYIHQPFSSK